MSRIWHTIRAKSSGEQLAHSRLRHAFLQHLVADDRVRRLFANWGDQYGLDDAIDTFGAALDIVVRNCGLSNRMAVRTDSSISAEVHRRLLALHQRVAAQLDETREARARDMVLFVATVLYNSPPPGPPPPLAWLGEDLLNVFDAEVAAHAWGTTIALKVPLAPTLTHMVPKGRRPKPGGDHLARYAEWYYRARVKNPRDTVAQLAADWRAQRGIRVASKSHDDARADTKPVRAGIAEAERLLTLPVPPWPWPDPMKVKGEKH